MAQAELFTDIGDFSVHLNNKDEVHISPYSDDWNEKPSISNKRFHCSLHFHKVNGVWTVGKNPYFSVPFKLPEVTDKQKKRVIETLSKALSKLEIDEPEIFVQVEKENHERKLENARATVKRLEQELATAKQDLEKLENQS
jgi:hypothetical protein